MTGYGKGVAVLEKGKLTVEIRSVNGKSADVSIKSSILPKEKEIEVRKLLSETLVRGTIDMFLTWEPNACAEAKTINPDLAGEYYRQIVEFAAATGIKVDAPQALLPSLLHLPGVVDSVQSQIVTEDNWPLVDSAIKEALQSICRYREDEGESLYRDVTSRVQKILDLYDEVEGLERERLDAVRERILKAADELKIKLEPERFEQEMIFYLEKLDINEEKVRLRQHCRYFMETVEFDSAPGRKLGFIIQEMGREINTTGSKANHAGIQKCVVLMKDELEKIREQSMNIL